MQESTAPIFIYPTIVKPCQSNTTTITKLVSGYNVHHSDNQLFALINNIISTKQDVKAAFYLLQRFDYIIIYVAMVATRWRSITAAE